MKLDSIRIIIIMVCCRESIVVQLLEEHVKSVAVR